MPLVDGYRYVLLSLFSDDIPMMLFFIPSMHHIEMVESR